MSAKIRLTAPPDVYQKRRALLAKHLTRPLVLFAGHAPARNYPTNPHRFRASSSYLYFGGPPLEHAALLIEPGSDGDAGCTLFRPTFGPDDILWFGDVPTDDDLADASGLNTASFAQPDTLRVKLAQTNAAAIIPPHPQTIAQARDLALAAANDDELRLIINQRLIKDEHELAAMRTAAEVTVDAHRAALAATYAGHREADVAAAFVSVLTANQCDHAFSPIITTRGEVLHGHGHANILAEGALLLCDAGAEEPGGYASDVTRTWPVTGDWTPIQRQLYETVEKAQHAAIAACTPGRRFRDVHDISAREICRGLVEAELLRGDPDELVNRVAHALFYPHGVGHLIGLDAHDMEDFGDLAGYAPGRSRRPEFGNVALRLDRDLEPGYCVTIEPGIYLVPAIWQRDDLIGPFADVINRSAIDALLRDAFGGIRIEHTIAITDEKPEVLTSALPTNADEVANLVPRI